MLDNTIRVGWLDALYRELLGKFKAQYPNINLPDDACVTVGYPPLNARGKRGERRGCYIGQEWHGNDAEKAFVTIHPERLKTPEKAAQAIVEEIVRSTWGPRRLEARLSKVVGECKPKIQEAVDAVGDPPPGFAQMTEPKPQQKARLLKVECPDCGYTVRVANSWLKKAKPICPDPECKNYQDKMKVDTSTQQKAA